MRITILFWMKVKKKNDSTTTNEKKNNNKIKTIVWWTIINLALLMKKENMWSSVPGRKQKTLCRWKSSKEQFLRRHQQKKCMNLLTN